MTDELTLPTRSLPMREPAAVGQLNHHNSFLFWISRLNTVLQDSFNQQLAHYDISWPQWLVINVLSQGAARTPAHIADHLGVDRSAVTRLLDRLEKKHYVERIHDKLDRRSVNVVLTPQGEDIVQQVNEAAYRHQQDFLLDLHRSERRGLKGELQKILRTAGIDTFDSWRRAD